MAALKLIFSTLSEFLVCKFVTVFALCKLTATKRVTSDLIRHPSSHIYICDTCTYQLNKIIIIPIFLFFEFLLFSFYYFEKLAFIVQPQPDDQIQFP